MALRENPPRINLKCDPERAIALRTEHAWIMPGYHMSKKHWNTVVVEDAAEPTLVNEMIDHSYALVVASLPKKVKDSIV